MTSQPDTRNVEAMREQGKVPKREWRRVERRPKFLAFDITAHCGPDASLVMLCTYENEHTYFMTADEALALSEALREAAEATHEPPEYERAPWLPEA